MRPSWLAILLAAVLAGCGFRTLHRSVQRAGELAILEGRVATTSGVDAPLVIAAYSEHAGRIADLFLLPRAGSWFFALPAGTYRVAAFEDRNRDFVYQPGEPAVSLPGPITLAPGERRGDVALAIDPAATTPLPFAIAALTTEGRQTAFLPELQQQLGTVVALDDPRFSADNGKLGLWDPLRFLTDVGAGLYFLEPYDPRKLPVLFVHGATGNPSEWSYLVAKLDRRRVQPWFLYYPSAAHLDRAGRWLARGLAALRVKYGFARLVMVAHSMGGLVTRAAINAASAGAPDERLVRLPAFVTLSTPWNGHAAAAAGVKRAPAVAPSWRDMAPDSDFLVSLPETPLPPECAFTLVFSYAGGSAFVGDANDGAVTLASQLALPMQRQAARVLGVDASHRSILRNDDVAAELNAIIARALEEP